MEGISDIQNQESGFTIKSIEFKGSVRMVASLGGFLGRKNDGELGTKTLWLGLLNGLII